jgi:hypothetical protein
MSDTKHTAGAWEAVELTIGWTIARHDPRTGAVVESIVVYCESTAREIVRACNAHDALLDACEELLRRATDSRILHTEWMQIRAKAEAAESRALYGGSVSAARTITRQIETVLAGDRRTVRVYDLQATARLIKRLRKER